MSDFTKLFAYIKANELSSEIFTLSKNFPVEEKYSLTSQIIRSSRSICANIAEAYRKRRYKPHFISKLTDSDAENSETLVWLRFAFESNYLDLNSFELLESKCLEVGRLLNYMINNPEKFMLPD